MSTPFPAGPGQPSSRLGSSSFPATSPFDPFGSVNPGLVGDCGAMLQRLYNYLDGELTDERRTKIQSHLDDCPSCFSAFDFEAELRIVVAAKCQTSVPTSLVDRIRATLSDSRAQIDL